MSSADLFEDGFPHGTADGYDKGCRGAGCSAGIEHGLSCKTAKIKSRSDFQYQKLVKTGASVAEIADALGLIGTAAAAAVAKAKPKPKPKRTASKPAPEVDPLPAVEYFGDYINRDAADDPTAAAIDEPTLAPAPAVVDPVEIVTESAEKSAPTPREIRAWAREKGYEVSTRGIIPTAVVENYRKAHGILDSKPAAEPVAEVKTLNDAHEIRAFVGPLRNDDGTLNASRVARESTLREKAGLPSWIAELDAPPADARPDFGTMNLEHDLTEAIAERDQARDLVARFWDELDRLERTRAEEQAATAAARKADADALDEARIDITNLTTALTTSKEDRHDLRTALAAMSGALLTTERALELVLQKWDDATKSRVLR